MDRSDMESCWLIDRGFNPRHDKAEADLEVMDDVQERLYPLLGGYHARTLNRNHTVTLRDETGS